MSKSNINYYGRGYKFEENGWIYIHIEGEPYKRGLQHGFLLANEAENQFASKVDIEFLDEIKGIADGACKAGVKVTWQEILTWNGYGELIDFWWPDNSNGSVKSNIDRNKGRCSAFIATGSKTNYVHNLFTSPGELSEGACD